MKTLQTFKLWLEPDRDIPQMIKRRPGIARVVAESFFFGKGAGDWLIAKDNNKFGSSGRSLANPNLRENPDTYLGQYWVKPVEIPAWENDYSGVHTNSGVQNYWFYLLSTS